jgi:apolipoprotein N-acyltransferase
VPALPAAFFASRAGVAGAAGSLLRLARRRGRRCRQPSSPRAPAWPALPAAFFASRAGVAGAAGVSHARVTCGAGGHSPRCATVIAALPSRIAAQLRSRSGWRAGATAFGLGALGALAFAPVHALPVLWLAIPGLLLMAGARSTRGALAIGWGWGLGHHVAGLYWISHALLTEAERFAWLVPIAVPAIAALLAVFIAVPVALSLWFPPGWPRILGFAGLWTLGELARGLVLTGFPWNLLGSAWAFGSLPVQGAAWVGVHGLSLATVVLAALPLVWSSRVAAMGGAMLAAGFALGIARLWPEEPPPLPVALRVIQGNIAQGHKWRDDLRAAHFRHYLALTASVPPPGPEAGEGQVLVIWPETASPYLLATDGTARDHAARALPDGAVLLAGTPRLERLPEGASPPIRIWNSLVALDDTGGIVAVYDKHHLVPFGEYVPLRNVLPIETIVPGNLDFSHGPGPRSVTLAGLAAVPAFSPLICYEVIFPGNVTARGERPGWLLNLTNDAWFGVSSGPYQHLAAARLRAVEEGLPLVRAANTGVSAIFDARGRTVAALGLNQTGVLAAPLPAALPPTPFSRGGLWIPLALALLAVQAGIVLRIRLREE